MNKLRSGQSLIELLLAVALLGIFLPVLVTGFVASREGRVQQNERVEAMTLLKEAQEAMRNVREKNWNLIAAAGNYYPRVASDNSWELVANANGETIGDFTRRIEISDVYRDNNNLIVTSGGALDPSTKKIKIIVSWTNPIPQDISSTTYLTRFLDNASKIWTTDTDFNQGIKNGASVTNTGGGEVALDGGGRGDWCNPNPSYNATLDLPKNGVANAISAIEGRVFAGTGENASGVSFAQVAITNTNLPVPSILGTTDGYKTNDLYGETNYVYIATDKHDKEIVILDISEIPYTEIGYFNAPGEGTGTSVFVSSNIGYMLSGSNLYNFDLSNKTGSRPAIDPDGVSLAGVGSKAIVIGNYAYVIIKGSSTKLQIVDLNNTANLQMIGYANLDAQDAEDIFVNQAATRAYVATANSSTQNEFFLIDITNKNGSHTALGSYDAGAMDPKGITVASGKRAIIVGTGGEEYQIVNINNESSPVRCGGLNIDSGINGVAAVAEHDGDLYSYLITGDASSELKIIEGGTGGQYDFTGEYESNYFNPPGGMDKVFNRFDTTIDRPAGTDIQFQVAVAQAVNNSCDGLTYTYVGPGGDQNQFFTTQETSGPQTINFSIPFGSYGGIYNNPGGCFKYKAFLSTSDPTKTAILYDFTVNYSP